MRFATILITFFSLILNVYASPESDTLIIKSDNNVERITRDLDSLISNWYVKTALRNLPVEYTTDSVGEEYPDSVYYTRLSRINSIISLPYNSIIRNHIHVYTLKQRKKFSIVLGLTDYYFPMIEDVFDSYGLPAELKYMAVIESALNPNAVSRAGATGLWQFMYSTGKLYGLTVNSVIDERRDPLKATHAAAKYIKDLYNIYNDWVLVIAAYNCGPGNVNKAIRRSGNKKDYWDIYYRLPRETRGYIPQYIAAVYAINYFAEHKLKPVPLDIPVAVDTIMVNKDIHLSQISEVMGIPIDELRALNPQYKTGFVPASTKPFSLTLPMTHVGDFIDLNDTIRGYKPDVYLSKSNRIADPTHSSYKPAEVKGKTKLIYTVQDGDNLGYISDWYNVGLSDLRYWNNIYRNTIRVGQKLVIYVDPSKSDYYSKISSMSFAEKLQMTGKEVPSNAQPIASLTPDETEGDFITYTVRYGDTIWDIVKMFDNVTTGQVLSLNNISDPGKIKIGQKLKIKKKS
ncbi:MAG TPA: transglycosylase SLT domain-containing protein [Bacteroidales bacterium]|nr:transglycosylase SLT domain-containing protein [Bacteroidales bacterium]HPT22111.1 transglycosylase SLT domain-containing protein [Bacteroidales bacterium]